MQVGDLVKVVCVDGHPMGMILEVSDHPSGYRIQQYLVPLFNSRYDRDPHQYLRHQLEPIR